MIPYEPTSSGTSWTAKSVPEMWGLISDIDLEPMYQQTTGWQKAIDLASTNLYRLKDFRDKLTTAWPPEKSQASQQYVTQLDGLIASVQDVYDAAVANKTSASNLTSSISEAQRTVKPLYDDYLANLQAQSDYDSSLANKKTELSNRYGGTTNRSYIYAINAYTNSNPNPGAAAKNAQITTDVRSAMSSLSTDLVVSSGKMVEPQPYQPPVLASRDTESGGGSSGGGYGGGSSGGGGGSGSTGSVPIVPMPAYVPPPQPTLTGTYTPTTPNIPTPAPVAPISTLPQPHPTAPIGMPTPVGPVGPQGVIKPPIGTGPTTPGPAGRMGPVIGPNAGGVRPGPGGMPGPGGRGLVGPQGVIGGGGGPGGRAGVGPGGVRGGVNPTGGVIGGRPGASGTPGAPGAGTGGVAGRGGAGGPGGRAGAGHTGMVGAGGRGKRGQSDEHGHEWDPDNPWEVAEGVAPVVEAPGEAGPIDPGPAIGGRR